MSDNVAIEYGSGFDHGEIDVYLTDHGEEIVLRPSVVRVFANDWVECRNVDADSDRYSGETLLFPPEKVDHIQIGDGSFGPEFGESRQQR